MKVWRHRLGTPQSADILIAGRDVGKALPFAEEQPPEVGGGARFGLVARVGLCRAQ